VIGVGCSTDRENRKACNILVVRPEEQRTRRRSSPGWEGNIKMDLMEIRWEDMYWMQLAQNRDQWRPLVNTPMNLQVWGISKC